jgi:bacterioferritin
MSIEYIKGIQQRVDTNELVQQLRRALADELNAAYNYHIQSKIIQGSLREEIAKELLQHFEEETGHANMLTERIIQLGGNPEIRPLDWDKFSNCRYEYNTTWDQRDILEVALRGEKCATEHYTGIAQFAENRDTTTYDIVRKILDDEYEHIRDLNKLKEMLHDNKKDSDQ